MNKAINLEKEATPISGLFEDISKMVKTAISEALEAEGLAGALKIRFRDYDFYYFDVFEKYIKDDSDDDEFTILNRHSEMIAKECYESIMSNLLIARTFIQDALL